MSGKKKIVYVITKSNWGGAQRYVYDLAAGLPPDRFEVAVACGGSGLLTEKLATQRIRLIPLPWLQRPINVGKEILALWALARTFARERPDIIHLSSSKAGGLGAVASRLASLLTRHRPRVIFTVHGWGFEEDRPWWQRAAIALLSWFAALFQDRIILIDASDYRVGRRFIPGEKLVLIHHGLAPLDFLPRETARRSVSDRANRPIESGTFLIGATAELTRNKGLTYLIAAIAEVKSRIHPASSGTRFKIQMVVMGEGEERAALERQIERLGLGDTVALIGFLPEAARYLKALDLFALPSLKEGLPYALMEAMASALPIVASRVGGIPDLLEHGKTGLLVPPKDAPALAEAIGEVQSRRVEAEALGREARRKIQAQFRIETMLEQTIALYESV